MTGRCGCWCGVRPRRICWRSTSDEARGRKIAQGGGGGSETRCSGGRAVRAARADRFRAESRIMDHGYRETDRPATLAGQGKRRTRLGSMSKRPLKVALLGCRVVGSEVARLMTTTADDLAARIGAPLELAGIAVRRPNRVRDLPVDPALFTTDALALATRPDVDVVIEVIGGIEPARSLLLAALANGASVVTANKALLAEDGATLHAAAEKHGGDLYYEAAVAGAIPLLRPLRESLVGDKVKR